MVEEFEKAFAAFCDTGHSIAVNSGTDALRFALMASGVQPGDVVRHRAAYVHCHDGSHLAGGAIPEFVDIRRAHLQHVDLRGCRTILEDAVHARSIGQAHQPAQRTASNGRRAGASLRTDGGHGPDSDDWPNSTVSS